MIITLAYIFHHILITFLELDFLVNVVANHKRRQLTNYKYLSVSLKRALDSLHLNVQYMCASFVANNFKLK